MQKSTTRSYILQLFLMRKPLLQQTRLSHKSNAGWRFRSPVHRPSSTGTGEMSLFSRFRRRSQVMSATSPRLRRRLLDRSKLSSDASATHGRSDKSDRELKPNISVCHHRQRGSHIRRHAYVCVLRVAVVASGKGKISMLSYETNTFPQPVMSWAGVLHATWITKGLKLRCVMILVAKYATILVGKQWE